ncbi:GTPase activating protein, partial [Reticulomyxa filosa]
KTEGGGNQQQKKKVLNRAFGIIYGILVVIISVAMVRLYQWGFYIRYERFMSVPSILWLQGVYECVTCFIMSSKNTYLSNPHTSPEILITALLVPTILDFMLLLLCILYAHDKFWHIPTLQTLTCQQPIFFPYRIGLVFCTVWIYFFAIILPVVLIGDDGTSRHNHVRAHFVAVHIVIVALVGCLLAFALLSAIISHVQISHHDATITRWLLLSSFLTVVLFLIQLLCAIETQQDKADEIRALELALETAMMLTWIKVFPSMCLLEMQTETDQEDKQIEMVHSPSQISSWVFFFFLIVSHYKHICIYTYICIYMYMYTCVCVCVCVITCFMKCYIVNDAVNKPSMMTHPREINFSVDDMFSAHNDITLWDVVCCCSVENWRGHHSIRVISQSLHTNTANEDSMTIPYGKYSQTFDIRTSVMENVDVIQIGINVEVLTDNWMRGVVSDRQEENLVDIIINGVATSLDSATEKELIVGAKKRKGTYPQKPSSPVAVAVATNQSLRLDLVKDAFRIRLQLFGVDPVDLHRKHCAGYEADLPSVLTDLKEKLFEVGGHTKEHVFRMMPHPRQVEEFRHILCQGKMHTVDYTSTQFDSHILAYFIRVWFREIPTRILNTVSDLSVIDFIVHDKLTTEAIPQICAELPPLSRALLYWLFDLCAEVSEKTTNNYLFHRLHFFSCYTLLISKQKLCC